MCLCCETIKRLVGTQSHRGSSSQSETDLICREQINLRICRTEIERYTLMNQLRIDWDCLLPHCVVFSFRCQTDVHTDAAHIHACPTVFSETILWSLSFVNVIPQKGVSTEPPVIVFNRFEGKPLRFCSLPNFYFEKQVSNIKSSVSVKDVFVLHLPPRLCLLK